MAGATRRGNKKSPCVRRRTTKAFIAERIAAHREQQLTDYRPEAGMSNAESNRVTLLSRITDFGATDWQPKNGISMPRSSGGFCVSAASSSITLDLPLLKIDYDDTRHPFVPFRENFEFRSDTNREIVGP